MITKVGGTIFVGEARIKMMVDVAVGEGVAVSRVGVMVTVGVEVGIALAVCVEAAFAVWAMKSPTCCGLAVANGAATEGITQAVTRATVVSKNRNFMVRVDMVPLPHPRRLRMQTVLYFSTLIATYG